MSGWVSIASDGGFANSRADRQRGPPESVADRRPLGTVGRGDDHDQVEVQGVALVEDDVEVPGGDLGRGQVESMQVGAGATGSVVPADDQQRRPAGPGRSPARSSARSTRTARVRGA